MRKFIFVFMALCLATVANFAIDNEFKNILLNIDFDKTGQDSYNINLETQVPYPEEVKIVKKSDYNYYILLSETFAKVAVNKINPEIVVADVRLYPYAEQDTNNGYTKISLTTSKPLNFSVSLSAKAASKFPVMDLVKIAKLNQMYDQYNTTVKGMQTAIVQKPVTTPVTVAKAPASATVTKAPVVATKPVTPSKPVVTAKMPTVATKPVTVVQAPTVVSKSVETVKKPVVAVQAPQVVVKPVVVKQAPVVSAKPAATQPKVAQKSEVTVPAQPKVVQRPVNLDKIPVVIAQNTPEVKVVIPPVQKQAEVKPIEQKTTSPVKKPVEIKVPTSEQPKQVAIPVTPVVAAKPPVPTPKQSVSPKAQTPAAKAPQVATKPVTPTKAPATVVAVKTPKAAQPQPKVAQKQVATQKIATSQPVAKPADLPVAKPTQAPVAKKPIPAPVTQPLPVQKPIEQPVVEQKPIEIPKAVETPQTPVTQEVKTFNVLEKYPIQFAVLLCAIFAFFVGVFQLLATSAKRKKTEDSIGIGPRAIFEAQKMQARAAEEEYEQILDENIYSNMSDISNMPDVEESQKAALFHQEMETAVPEFVQDFAQEFQSVEPVSEIIDEPVVYEPKPLIEPELITEPELIPEPEPIAEVFSEPVAESILFEEPTIVFEAEQAVEPEVVIEPEIIEDQLAIVKEPATETVSETLLDEEFTLDFENDLKIEEPKMSIEKPIPIVEEPYIPEIKPELVAFKATTSPIEKVAQAPKSIQDVAKIISSAQVENDRGFYLADFKGVKSLVGYIMDNVFVIHSFKDQKIKNTQIDFRLSESDKQGDFYLVKVGDTKLLIKSEKEKMSLVNVA